MKNPFEALAWAIMILIISLITVIFATTYKNRKAEAAGYVQTDALVESEESFNSGYSIVEYEFKGHFYLRPEVKHHKSESSLIHAQHCPCLATNKN